MNKYQEALNILKNIVLVESNDGYHDPRTLCDFYWEICDKLQELVDKETKVSKLHEEIYDAYHHGTKEECDKQVSELIYQIEYDWSDQE